MCKSNLRKWHATVQELSTPNCQRQLRDPPNLPAFVGLTDLEKAEAAVNHLKALTAGYSLIDVDQVAADYPGPNNIVLDEKTVIKAIKDSTSPGVAIPWTPLQISSSPVPHSLPNH